MKKTAILCVLLCIVSFFVFGEGQGEKTTETGVHGKIKAVLDIIIKPEDGQAEWAGAYKKLTGYEIEIIQPPHNEYDSKLKIMIASGEIPDIFETKAIDAALFAMDGALVPLDEYIETNENMKSIPRELIDAYRLKDGKIYCFPLNLGGGCVPYIRKDWLDNLGMDVPTTYDEMVKVMEAFTYDDPDGNNKDDTYGYSTTLIGDGIFQDMYNRSIMQDARVNFTRINDEWVDGFAQESMRHALKRWQDLYKAGVIDPEIFTNKTSTMREKFYQSRVGIFEYWVGNWGVNIDRNTKSATGDHAHPIPIIPIQGSVALNRVAPVFAISFNVKDPKAIFDNFIGLMWDKGPGQMLFTYGVEGLHWKRNADGKVEMQPAPSTGKNIMTKVYSTPEYKLNDWERPVDLDPRAEYSLSIWQKKLENIPLEIGGEYYKDNIADLHNLRLKIFSKVVKGDLSVDQGVSMYLEESKNLHVSEMLKELNE